MGAEFHAGSHDEADGGLSQFSKGVISFDIITGSIDYSVCNKNRVITQEFVVTPYFSSLTVHKMTLKT